MAMKDHAPTHPLHGLDFLDPSSRDAVRRVADAIRAAGGRTLLVGGCVRDALLGVVPKDLDIEAYGIGADVLERLLRRAGFGVVTVGRAFGVFKLQHEGIDVALPRRESKSGTGHKGFAVQGDPDMSPHEAALRRDFTINAISYDVTSGVLVDPLDGVSDLRKGLLRHCGPQFVEDPLRVLRAMQFLARFRLDIDPATLDICRSIGTEGLPAERLCEEWRKLIVAGAEPSRGLRFLRDCGWLRFYPELAVLVGCPQDPHWHPEGDVWTHTLHAMDAFAASRVGDAREDWIVGLAVLCHDMGKPMVTALSDGRLRSLGHDSEGEAPTRAFLMRLMREREVIEDVVTLVRNHHQPHHLHSGGAGPAAIRRLSLKVGGRLDRLARVVRADHAGRPPLPAEPVPEIDWLLAKAETLSVRDNAPKPLVLGRHLIALGIAPSLQFKTLLDACFEAQLDGEFADEASGIEYLKTLLHSPPP